MVNVVKITQEDLEKLLEIDSFPQEIKDSIKEILAARENPAIAAFSFLKKWVRNYDEDNKLDQIFASTMGDLIKRTTCALMEKIDDDDFVDITSHKVGRVVASTLIDMAQGINKTIDACSED